MNSQTKRTINLATLQIDPIEEIVKCEQSYAVNLVVYTPFS